MAFLAQEPFLIQVMARGSLPSGIPQAALLLWDHFREKQCLGELITVSQGLSDSCRRAGSSQLGLEIGITQDYPVLTCQGAER